MFNPLMYCTYYNVDSVSEVIRFCEKNTSCKVLREREAVARGRTQSHVATRGWLHKHTSERCKGAQHKSLPDSKGGSSEGNKPSQP